MIEHGDVLRCARTGMELSRNLRHDLEEAFIARARSSRPAVGRAIRLRQPIFCPGCGVHLAPDGCPRCGGVLDELAHAIVELHPHE